MSITPQDLDSFHRFADAIIRSESVESLEELVDLWRIEHPTADEKADIHEAIRQGLADIKAGHYKPADEVTAEVRAKHGL